MIVGKNRCVIEFFYIKFLIYIVYGKMYILCNLQFVVYYLRLFNFIDLRL